MSEVSDLELGVALARNSRWWIFSVAIFMLYQIVGAGGDWFETYSTPRCYVGAVSFGEGDVFVLVRNRRLRCIPSHCPPRAVFPLLYSTFTAVPLRYFYCTRTFAAPLRCLFSTFTDHFTVPVEVYSSTFTVPLHYIDTSYHLTVYLQQLLHL